MFFAELLSPGRLSRCLNVRRPRLSCCESPSEDGDRVCDCDWYQACLVNPEGNVLHVEVPVEGVLGLPRGLQGPVHLLQQHLGIVSTQVIKLLMILSISHLHLLHVFPDVVVLLHQVLVNSILYL